MAYILNIETATKNCSVSIALNGETIALKELNDGEYSHAEKLHEYINEVISVANIQISEIKAVAVSKGPGSYTGLRIGVSAAKGICFALDIPLISVHTLKAMAASISIEKGVKIPLLDARRMEVYAAVLDSDNNFIKDVFAEIITENSFEDYLNESPVYFFGDGAEKCKEVIKHANIHFIDHIFPSAKDMGALSYEKYKKNDIEDVAYFEPFYLKDFVVIPSKK